MHKNFLILYFDYNWHIEKEFDTLDEVNKYLLETEGPFKDLMVVQYIPIILRIDEFVLG